MARVPTHDRYQAPLMLAFAEPHRRRQALEKDSRQGSEQSPERAKSLVAAPGRVAGRREIIAGFRRSLETLANTIDLASARDLEPYPMVAGSILNYGLPDVTPLTAGSLAVASLVDELRQALLRHEPRLIAESLLVEQGSRTGFIADASGFDSERQRLRFEISAELAFNPQPIPVAFHADLDVAAGKVAIDTATLVS
ncbi:type VI secretion system baseplate subunit TssE [Jiella marina]|uniref:type VI secretion system baseplate subunit TssE n=1 Tax=Jiella sp. LLJ827 TaxID=2917712 RepID=UPI002100A097|nr:GPW/gp25 family protein [Jiella sp. LLJ827]MCQ0989526.1 GPW/gp25 family protein [Jiella sp. LLJ827]